MKKIHYIVIAIVVVVCIVVGIIVIASCNKNDNNGNNNNNGETFEYGQNYIENHLGDYWIIYTVTTFDGDENDIFTMEQKRTSEGYYWVVDGSKMLFIKNGDDFDWYSCDEEDEDYNFIMTSDKESTESTMSAFMGYMMTYDSWSDSLVRNGSETVAGKDCAKYSFNYSYPGYGSYKYIYCIEKTTGVCLKFIMEIQSAGTKIGYEFLCSKFETTGVTLPDYN